MHSKETRLNWYDVLEAGTRPAGLCAALLYYSIDFCDSPLCQSAGMWLHGVMVCVCMSVWKNVQISYNRRVPGHFFCLHFCFTRWEFSFCPPLWKYSLDPRSAALTVGLESVEIESLCITSQLEQYSNWHIFYLWLQLSEITDEMTAHLNNFLSMNVIFHVCSHGELLVFSWPFCYIRSKLFKCVISTSATKLCTIFIISWNVLE